MRPLGPHTGWKVARRDFLCAAGATAAGVALAPHGGLGATPSAPAARARGVATVRGAFLYPPTEVLRQAGYYSWPGSGFDAEGHHKQYAGQIGSMARKLNARVVMAEKPLYEPADVAQFIAEVKREKPDGLLLIAFKKSEWESVTRIIDETGIPTIAVATLGVLLMPHIQALQPRPGVYVISSVDNFEAIEYGLKMIAAAHWMKESRILSVAKTQPPDRTVEKLGTQIRAISMGRFVEVYQSIEATDQVREIARAYMANARERREPSEADVLDAARAYVACKRVLEEEQADAIMMECLDGIQARQIPPPCLGFMSLRDAGIVAGCQNDLDATLTMMLVQRLLDKPGFQQNAACDTEKNLYFGAHCTCPTKLEGPGGPAVPYILRNHAEAGVGAVPQVLWPVGADVTMAHYLTGQPGQGPQMLIYSGRVVACHDTPPAGGCRTNVALRINEVDACNVEGMHQTVFLGNHAQQLRSFCQLLSITAAT